MFGNRICIRISAVLSIFEQPVLACSPAQGLSTSMVRLELVRGEVEHPEPQSRPEALYGL